MKYQKSQNRTPVTSVKFTLYTALLCAIFLAIGNNKTIAMADSQRHRDVTNEKRCSTNVLPGPKWKTLRPRLFFTPERIKRLRRQIEEEAALREAWLKLLKRADRLLGKKLVSKEYADDGTGQHGNYGRPSSQVGNMASTLGLAYQMTGEKRYAEKLREALIHYGGLKRWAGDAKSVRFSYWATLLLVLIGVVIGSQVDSIADIWNWMMMVLGAGMARILMITFSWQEDLKFLVRIVRFQISVFHAQSMIRYNHNIFL